MESQIKEIFNTRDKAIAEHNQQLLLSTQVGEIPKSGSEGYIKTDKQISKVLHVHHDDKDPSLWVALVQEDYFFNNNFSHRGYLLYKLVEKSKKLLISEIVW
jgi:hypothetical protein